MPSEHDELPDDATPVETPNAPPPPKPKPATQPKPPQNRRAEADEARRKRYEELAAEYDFSDEETEFDPVHDSVDVQPGRKQPAQKSTSTSGSSVSGDGAGPAAPPPPPKHDPLTLQLAREYQLSDEELKLPPEQLTRLVGIVHRRELAREKSVGDALRAQQPRPGDDPATPAAGSRAGADHADDAAIDWGEEERDGQKVKVTDDDIHPSLVKVIKDQARRIRELEALSETVKTLAGREQARAAQTAAQQIDGAFAALGEDFHPLFGAGGVHSGEVKADSMEYFRRKAVLDSFAKVPPGPGSVEENIQKRARELFGAGLPSTPKFGSSVPTRKTPPKDPETGRFVKPDEYDEAQAREEAWVRGGTARPTHREADDLPKGRERAIRKVREMKEQLGILNGDASEDEYNDLPG